MKIKCAYCGKYVAHEDLINGKAKYEFTPDSPFGPEINCWICEKCKEKEKMSVKRYGPACLRDCDGDWFTTGVEEHADGDYVLHSDYATLEARNAALVEAARPVAEWWKSSPDGIPMRQAATEIMGLMTRKEAETFDALAALVGEE